ncbi:MAG: cation diffusion facilitator family transporter [Gammaproteobacteria bacterium]|nr:cation diffusion facilitator family transporter [Gammaproteobacteria bacterium]
MSHAHASEAGNIRPVRIAFLITALFTVVEAVGGLLTNSLALIADAGHMLTDSMALGLALLAFRVSSRPADTLRSYGYHRFQILAAFVNGLALIGIVLWILVEAVQRFQSPPEVRGLAMMYIALAGLVVNVVSFLVLHSGDRDNLNIQGAALHVLGDLLGSVAAIAAAVVILWTGWMPIDPILSVAVALLVLRSALVIVRKSAHILLEGAPEWFDVDEMKTRVMRAVPDVSDVHHVHVWGLTQQRLMLTMHVVLKAQGPDNTGTLRAIKNLLSADYGIEHTTIEVESDDCADHVH